MVTGIDLLQNPGVGGVAVVKVLLAQNPTVPVGRWVRWKITLTGASAPWSVTFRILCCGNPSGAR